MWHSTLLSLQGVQSPLYVSCDVGNMEIVQLLVHHHAAINQPCDVSNALYNSTSLSLFFVVLFTESPAYSVLFTSSLLSCLPQDEYAATPLITASVENHVEVARMLIKYGASTDYQNKVFDNLFVFSRFAYDTTFTYSTTTYRMATPLFKLHATMEIQTLWSCWSNPMPTLSSGIKLVFS